MAFVRRIATTVALLTLGGIGACGEDITGPIVTTPLQCGAPADAPTPCTLTIAEKSRFDLTLKSSSCAAHGNKIRLILPAERLLSSDACYEEVGKVWGFDGPYDVGATVNFAVEAAQLPRPAELRVTGAYPLWTVTFEDGGDSDYDDVVIEVKATPVP